MSSEKKCSAGSLIYATALHTNETVLNDISNTYAVSCSNLVAVSEKVSRRELLSVNFNRDTLLELDGYICRSIRCLLRRNHELKDLVEVRLICRILKIHTLVREVPEVLVLGIVVLLCNGNIDSTSLSVVDLFVT